MRQPGPENFVAALTWDEVNRRLKQGAVAILPVGAGAKQHGFHLPMGTDQLQADWFAARLADTTDALIWPALTYGAYPAFAAYAGSITLSNSTFVLLVAELLQGVRSHTPNRIIVLDTGISTITPIGDAIRRSGVGGALHLCIYAGSHYQDAASRLRQQSYGSHADEMETSVMLALAHEYVQMSRAVASPDAGKSAPGPLTPHDQTSPNFSASGSFGDPTKASAEKGRVLVEAILSDLSAALAEP